MTGSPAVLFTINGRQASGQRRGAGLSAVTVNGEVVPKRAIAAEARNHLAAGRSRREAWEAAANALAIRTLLVQEARRRGVAPTPRKVGPDRHETDEEAAIRALLEQEIDVPAPDEQAVRAEWARDPDRFRSPPLWEVAHILCACKRTDDAGMAEAHARASAITAQLRDDPAAFGRIARSQSDCGSRPAGGALGQIGPGDTVPEFEAAVRALSQGEITPDPVPTRHGWHVIRLDAVAEGQRLPFEAVKAPLAEAMEKSAWARAAQDVVRRLAAEADIKGVTLKTDTENGARHAERPA